MGSRETVGATGRKVAVGAIVGAVISVTVGRSGVKVGETVGVKVGKVGVGLHNGTPGKVAPGTGTVGATVGKEVAVGQIIRPLLVVGTVKLKGRIGAARGVNLGASVVVVGNIGNGGMITAKPYDDIRQKIITKNKLMRKSLSDLILNSP